jgi:dihydroorotate dehydrogenase electron transfer subunit
VQYVTATVDTNTQLSPGNYELVLRMPVTLPDITAGQFLNLRCDPAERDSLLRPFSILDFDAVDGTVSVFYKQLGRLSTRLADMPPGTPLDCVYPLGHGFPWRNGWRRVALVGGGVGIAPLLFMAQQLLPHGATMHVTGFFGGATQDDLVPQLLDRHDFPMQLATMDGSAGFRGTVVDLFQSQDESFDAVYTCGPNRMMQALQLTLPAGCAAYASLEEYMACGVGACYGCTVRVKVEGKLRNLTVCKDGPVFDLRAVDFSA